MLTKYELVCRNAQNAHEQVQGYGNAPALARVQILKHVALQRCCYAAALSSSRASVTKERTGSSGSMLSNAQYSAGLLADSARLFTRVVLGHAAMIHQATKTDARCGCI